MIATDRSADALALARENARANGLDVELRQADLIDGLAGPFDLVVSNPPYVARRRVGDARAGGAH